MFRRILRQPPDSTTFALPRSAAEVIVFGNTPYSMAFVLTVSVYDFAHIGSKTLNDAERVAAEAFVSAGIVARLTTANSLDKKVLGSDFSATPGGGCVESELPPTIRAQILPHAPPRFSPGALGYSLPCARQGAQITLFADRMEAVSHTANASFYRVLGHSLAHELGHVLRRSSGHDPSGLMKDVWNQQDWRRAAISVVSFSSERPSH
jgi:hypothetical protein